MENLKGFGSNKFVVVAGSKNLRTKSNLKKKLAKKIGAKIVQEPNWVLLNGGAKNSASKPKKDGSAIDYFACVGAEKELEKSKDNLEDKILTIHPQSTNHDLHYIGSVEKSKRKTSALRRYDLVARADAVITIEGSEGSFSMLELGMAFGKPVLPIPCTGGESRQCWKTYKKEIFGKFDITSSSDEYEILENGLNSSELLSKTVISLVKKSFSPHCFVAMPLHKDFSKFYYNYLKSIIQEIGFVSIRGDEILSTGSIITDVFEAINSSRVVIADVTNSNPNVMYEIGMAHALDKDVILICRVKNDEKISKNLPFDIKHKRVYSYSEKNVNMFKENLTKIFARF